MGLAIACIALGTLNIVWGGITAFTQPHWIVWFQGVAGGFAFGVGCCLANLRR